MSATGGYDATLEDPIRAGVYRLPEQPEALRAEALRHGLEVRRVDLTGVYDKEGFLSAFARALRFPAWFGGNWDAFHDCLTDLSWFDSEGFLISIENARQFFAASGEDFRVALEIFRSAVEEWREEGVALWVFVDLPVPEGAELPTIE